jgi:methionine-rich copper-binding protein CopC
MSSVGYAALVMATLAMTPAAAWAHAHLASASPAENATVAAPEQVVLGFTQPLENSFSSIEVQSAEGRRVDDGKSRSASDPAKLIVGLGHLPAGIYKVIWHATSVDTHRSEGAFTFMVAP